MIYLRNKDQQDLRWLAASRISLIVLAASQRKWMINTVCCMYSKLHPDDEELIYSKHVEDDYWNKLREEKGASYLSLLCKCCRLLSTLALPWQVESWKSEVSRALRNVRITDHAKQRRYVELQETHIFLASISLYPINFGYRISMEFIVTDILQVYGRFPWNILYVNII
jgi:hypothetical protein